MYVLSFFCIRLMNDSGNGQLSNPKQSLKLVLVKASPIGLKPIFLSPLSSLLSFLSPLSFLYISYLRMYGSHRTLAVIYRFCLFHLSFFFIVFFLATWYQSETEESIERNLSLPAGGSLPLSYPALPCCSRTCWYSASSPDGFSPSRRYFAAVFDGSSPLFAPTPDAAAPRRPYLPLLRTVPRCSAPTPDAAAPRRQYLSLLRAVPRCSAQPLGGRSCCRPDVAALSPVVTSGGCSIDVALLPLRNALLPRRNAGFCCHLLSTLLRGTAGPTPICAAGSYRCVCLYRQFLPPVPHLPLPLRLQRSIFHSTTSTVHLPSICAAGSFPHGRHNCCIGIFGCCSVLSASRVAPAIWKTLDCECTGQASLHVRWVQLWALEVRLPRVSQRPWSSASPD